MDGKPVAGFDAESVARISRPVQGEKPSGVIPRRAIAHLRTRASARARNP